MLVLACETFALWIFSAHFWNFVILISQMPAQTLTNQATLAPSFDVIFALLNSTLTNTLQICVGEIHSDVDQ